MSMRRFLAALCSLCFIFSTLFSAAYAFEAPNLDDMGIDPWGDLGIIQQTPEPTPAPELTVRDPDPEDPQLDMAGEGAFAIMPVALEEGVEVTYRIWQGSPSFSYKGSSLFENKQYLVETGEYTNKSTQMLSHQTSWRSFGGSNMITANADAKLFGYTAIGAITGQATTSYDYGGESVGLYGSVVHLTNFSYDKNDGDFLVLSGRLFSAILVGTSWYANSKTFYGVSGAKQEPAFLSIQYSFDGEEFFPLPDGSTYNYETGELYTKLPIEIIVNDIYFSFSMGPSSVLASNSTGVSRVIGQLFYYLNYDQLSMKPVSEQGSGGVDEETKGLLGTIVSWLTSIRDGIVNVGTAIVELPGKIVTGILDGLKGLFVPSEEDLQDLKDKYQDLLSERLGFVWQAGEWITSFGSDLLAAVTGGKEAEFMFPGVGFDMNGEHYQLIEEQPVDFGDNGVVQVIRPFIGTIVAFVVVIACVNLFGDMAAALISGKSYFDFLKGGGDAA